MPTTAPPAATAPTPGSRHAATARATPRRRPPLRTLLAAEVLDEIRQVRREPASIFFSMVMPAAFFALFVGLFGGEQADAVGRPVGTSMLATYGAYGALSVVMLLPGVGLAEARETGWVKAVRTSPVPVPVTLAARVVASIPYCLGILLALTATAAAMGVLDIRLGEWLLLVLALVVGALPFALIGLAVGSLASGNAAVSILNALMFPLVIAGGLWFPLEMLPGWVQSLAPGLPTYHLSQLALAAIGGGAWIGSAAYLVAATAVLGAVATAAYRRSPV